jgi:hypothetical protein
MRILLCAALSLCIAAQPTAPSRLADGLNSIRASDLKADLTFLSSDELEGRLSLQRGSEIAIKWIVSEFEKAGLKPAGAGNSYLQPVPLIEYRTDREASGLTVRNGSKPRTFHAPEAAGAFPNDVSINAPVVFAGFGITAPELHYDDYASIDARGKIVLIFDHEPQERDANSIFNGKGNTLYAGSYMKTLTAQKHGAVALIVMPEPNRSHPSNQERLARIRPGNLRARIASQALEESAVHIPLFSVEDQAGASLLGPGGKALQQAIDSTLKPQSHDLPGVTAELKMVNSERRRATTYNVVGLIEGSDPTLARETIVFSAHYDHDGIAPSGIYHGADDNGSGTVGVIELGRAFAKNATKPRRSLLFAIFAAEERGLLGSYYYVSHPLRPLDLTRAVINFDMIGRDETPSGQTNGLIDIAAGTSNELNLVGTNYSPDYKAVVEHANEIAGLKLNYKWDEEPALNVFFRSDHYPFAMHGVPALWWFTGFHPDYHQTTDTAEKINYEKMVKILKLAFVTGFDLADGPKPPQFKP